MRRFLSIATLLATAAIAAEPPAPTPEQQIENLTNELRQAVFQRNLYQNQAIQSQAQLEATQKELAALKAQPKKDEPKK